MPSTLPFSDTQDFEDATRGLIAHRRPNAVVGDDGNVVWDNDSYDFLRGDAPDSVNPSLWRQSKLAAIEGLFEVVPGLYQVRGLDLSNISIIEGDEGIVVIDTLLSEETAAAALALYREHRGDRPVKAVVITHSHADHFGGIRAFVSESDVAEGTVKLIAPEGFLEHSVVENVYAGTAMSRRAAYMYGAALERGPQGQVGAGLGQTVSTGTVTLLPPTDVITTTGQEMTVDGVRMVFQMAPDTEAPSEMLIYLPTFKALCAAEDATHTFHNILTLRGAVVRDPHGWSKYLTETIDLFGDEVEVVFASHHWLQIGAGRADQLQELGVQSGSGDQVQVVEDQEGRSAARGDPCGETGRCLVGSCATTSRVGARPSASSGADRPSSSTIAVHSDTASPACGSTFTQAAVICRSCSQEATARDLP